MNSLGGEITLLTRRAPHSSSSRRRITNVVVVGLFSSLHFEHVARARLEHGLDFEKR